MSTAMRLGINSAALPVLAELLLRLEKLQVRYCHWKGTEHLDAALAARKDVDLLVDPRDAAAFERAVAASGGRRFVPPPGRAEPGLEDHLMLDGTTGRLVHLHVHYHLTLTQRNARGFRLPWTELLLSTRRLDRALGLRVPDPAVELVVFATRGALGLRWRDFFRPGRAPGLSREREREFAWLLARAPDADVRRLAEHMVGADAAQVLAGMRETGPTLGALRALRRRMHPRPAELATYGPLAAGRRLWQREWSPRLRRLRHRRSSVVPHRRTPATGGKMIAFLGVDGAGKSTLMTETSAWLRPRMDVLTVYLGGGKGEASSWRSLLRTIAAARERLRRKPALGHYPHPGQAVVHGERRTGVPARLRELWFVAWALSLARDRRRALTRARRARARGMVVIADRFPQTQFPGLSDAPLLTPWLNSPSLLLRAAARRERELFGGAALTSPDLVIRLAVAAERAHRRRPRTDPELLARKGQVVAGLVFPPETVVAEIDANQPLESVLAAVKSAIWEIL